MENRRCTWFEVHEVMDQRLREYEETVREIGRAVGRRLDYWNTPQEEPIELDTISTIALNELDIVKKWMLEEINDQLGIPRDTNLTLHS